VTTQFYNLRKKERNLDPKFDRFF